MQKKIIFFIIYLNFSLTAAFSFDIPKGIFGVSNIDKLNQSNHLKNLRQANIKSVFVQEDKKTIKWHKDAGYEVFISINAFGGACPTDQAWRSEKLKHIENLVENYGGKGGIDGIWLDFIRYPGFWEEKNPNIPDACIDKFTGLNNKYELMKWKKEQILSFVKSVSEILKKNKRKIKLGLFIVPWAKGDRNGEICYKLGQDAFELSKLADVISPMVYHKMCGKTESWVGYMTRYYKETADCEVWPIVQSVDIKKEELKRIMEISAQAYADGLFIFSYDGMKNDSWNEIKLISKPDNLIENNNFDKFVLRNGESNLNSNCIGISDSQRIWKTPIKKGQIGKEYIFTGYFYRKHWDNGLYPIIRIWGQEFVVDTNLMVNTFQPVRIHLTCPKNIKDNTLQFINNDFSCFYRLCKPRLIENFEKPYYISNKSGFFYNDFFPIGVYGADIKNLESIKKLAVNTVIIGGDGENLKKLIQKCHELNLRYVFSTPRDPERLKLFIDEIKAYVIEDNAAFYVNDEPEIYSFSINTADDINKMIKDSFPKSSTCMANVRADNCRDYINASDFFMLDQYPVPFMPMTWLSDSMDILSNDLGKDKLLSIIQAFGGDQHKDYGWPRMPTWQEIDCLSFLSVIHGSRGIFFFSFNEIGQTENGRNSLAKVIGRLNEIYTWLKEKKLYKDIKINMISQNKFDPKGRPSVHCVLKKKGNQLLLISVNTIHTNVEAEISSNEFHGRGKAKEIYSKIIYPLIDGSIKIKYAPYEAKIFVIENI